jgi:SET domain-containing protein
MVLKESKKNMVVKESRNGLGLFAKEDFSAGEKVIEIKGELITCYEDDDIDETTRNNTYRYDSDLYINPTGFLGYYLNHSCLPNAYIKKIGKKLFVIARNNIKEGDEIVFDYSTTLASDDVWEMDCNCGESNCRGLVERFTKLPKKLKEEYIRFDMVPEHVVHN